MRQIHLEVLDGVAMDLLENLLETPWQRFSIAASGGLAWDLGSNRVSRASQRLATICGCLASMSIDAASLEVWLHFGSFDFNVCFLC